MAKVQASRADTLEGFLDELPDLPNFFSYPVDDFFDNYVEELGQRGLQPETSEGTAAKTPNDVEEGGTVTAGHYNRQEKLQDFPSAMSLELPTLPTEIGADPYSSVGNSLNVMPAIGNTNLVVGNPASENSGSGVWDPVARNSKQPSGRPKKQPFYADYTDIGMDSDEAEHGVENPTGTQGGGKTKRNPKQQVQNKQAQQRYRERRKQRYQEMEHTIDGLTLKIQHMHAIQTQNALLQTKRDELEAMLREKEVEIDRLRAQLVNGQRSPSAVELEESSLEQRRKAEEANVRECQSKASVHVEELREFIERHGLRTVNPTGEGVNTKVVQELAEMVGKGCSTCQSAMRAEGVKVLKLMSRDVQHLSRIDCLRECNKWTRILDILQLTDIQKEQLMLLRKNHLRNLRQVYELRQQLNMQAMALMLPPAERAAGKDLDGKMACMSLSGYSKCARATVDLDDILNSIKENLRLEQKHVMEMNFVTMHRLMSPLQAALFLTEVYPAYCDALALANVLASQLEDRHKSSSGSEEPHKAGSRGSQGLDHPSPTSSADRSDTCPLLRQELDNSRGLDIQES